MLLCSVRADAGTVRHTAAPSATRRPKEASPLSEYRTGQFGRTAPFECLTSVWLRHNGGLVRTRLVLVCCAVAAAFPTVGRAAVYELQPGQAFAVAGTREGCASTPATAEPVLRCSLWGRTTRIIPGTLYFEFGQSLVDVFQRTLSGEPGLLREYPEPAQTIQSPAASAGESIVFVVDAGDSIAVAGTDVGCVVAKRRGDLGVRCTKLDAGTGLPLAASTDVTLSELAVTATRIRPDRSVTTSFALAQPYVPRPLTVARSRRSLAAAVVRLRAIRRSHPAFSAHQYAAARTALVRIIDDVDHDRFADACLRLQPLLYAGAYLPRGEARHLFVRQLRKVDGRLCR
jgi:hypothetical protein